MDSEDPELAKEMIKLLGQELKLLRAQLQEQSKNPLDDLERSSSTSPNTDRIHIIEAENAQLKAQIQLLRSHESDENKNATQVEMALKDVSQKLKKTLAEKDKLQTEMNEELSCLHNKITKNREKYKAQKMANADLQNALDSNVAQLKMSTEELNAAHERAERAEGRVWINSAEKAKEEFNIEAFVTAARTRVRPNEIKTHTTNPNLFLHKKVRDMCSPDGFLQLSEKEVIWSSDKISRVVVIFPLHRYNQKIHDGRGGWENGSKPVSVGQRRDIFFREGSWSYLGTFKCVKSTTIKFDQLNALSPLIRDHIYYRTVLFQELVPPFLSKMIEGMYAAGALRAGCFAFKFDSFNTDLNQEFLGEHTAMSHSKKGNPIPIPGRKRTRTNEGNYIPPKKRKT